MPILNIYQLEKQIIEAMRSADVPGASLAIIAERALIYARGFGMAYHGPTAPDVTPQTLFRAGSLTKSMTAAAIMRLVEAAKLNLDAPILEYLPDLVLSEPAYTPQITLRGLLSHTSGLPSSHSAFASRADDGLAEYVKRDVLRYPFIAPPNTVYSYSNVGVRLAGYVLEVVGEKPYTQLMQELIFAPLAMHRTTFDPTIAMTYPLAQSHQRDAEGALHVEHRYADNTGGNPSGFVITNVLDLARYALMYLDGGLDLLTPESIRQMHTPQTRRYLADDAAYGLGFMVKTSSTWGKIVGHEGLINSFGSKIAMLPEHGVAIMLQNNYAHRFWDAVDEIFEAIYAALLPTQTPTPKRSDAIAPNPDFVGYFEGAERGVIQIDADFKIHWNGVELSDIEIVDADLIRAEKNGQAVWLGMPHADFLMVDGSPCRRSEPRPAFEPDITQYTSYVGRYIGADRLNVTLEDGQLQVASAEYNKTCPAFALAQHHFATDLGMVVFQPEQNQLILGDVYPHQKEISS